MHRTTLIASLNLLSGLNITLQHFHQRFINNTLLETAMKERKQMSLIRCITCIGGLFMDIQIQAQTCSVYLVLMTENFRKCEINLHILENRIVLM